MIIASLLLLAQSAAPAPPIDTGPAGEPRVRVETDASFFLDADSNGDGVVEQDEFVEAIGAKIDSAVADDTDPYRRGPQWEPRDKDAVRQLFGTWDRDGDGRLTRQEFGTARAAALTRR